MRNKENLLKAIKRQSPEWVPYGMESVLTIGFPVIERPEKAGKDDFGVSWSYKSGAEGGTYPSERDIVIPDIKKWRDHLNLPEIETKNWQSVENSAKNLDRDRYILQGFCEMGLFERSYLLLGMEEALVAYQTDPDDMYDMCEAIADYKIALIEKFHSVAKMDMLWYGDDWGTQINLFISPEIWRKIIKPHTMRIYKCLKDLNVIINQHSCGKIESIFGDICEMGADIWNPCQPCNDLYLMKQKYGDKICFSGGVDSQFVLANPDKTPEDVKKEVIKRINEMALPNGGYITAPSHGVPYDKNKLEAMESSAINYGREIYKNRGKLC